MIPTTPTQSHSFNKIPTTPTLPTVIITPSTPLYPAVPSRSSYKYTPTPTASSSRSSTRKQHLISAMELDEKPDQPLLLPSPANANTHRPRRCANGLLLSLMVLGIFALVLVGPVMSYRWYAGMNAIGVPVVEAEGYAWAPTAVTESAVAELTSTGIGKRWDLHASRLPRGV